MILDSINILLLFVIFVLSSALYIVLAKSRDKIVAYSYSAVIFSGILWTLSMMLYRSVDLSSSLFWCKILYVSATFTSSTTLFFSIVFPDGKMPKIKQTVSIFLLNILIAALVVWPDLIIKDVNIIPLKEKEVIWGNYYFLYFLYVSSVISGAIWILFRKYLKAHGLVKTQIKFIFLAYFIGSGFPLISNLVLPWFGYFQLNWLGQAWSVILVSLTVYAIIKHRLMDIKFVLRRYAVYSVSMGLIVMPLIVIKYLVNLYFPSPASIIDFFLLFVAILVFSPIKNKTYHLANKFFFSSLYDSSQVIAEVSDKLRSTLNIDQLYNYIYTSLDNAMHVKTFGILRYNEKGGCYSTKFNINFDTGGKVDFERNDIIQKNFLEKNKPLIVTEASVLEDDPKTKDTLKMLHAMKVEILMPLNVKNNVVGLIVLGAKESGDMYNDEDLQVLGIVASQSAIAIENAMLYEETKNFSIKMEEEVKKATTDLRVANAKLKKLDAAKSEFISIASHQLRTPLTVIKGYISMMVEGSFGKLSDPIKDSLGKVYESNERLISLVENLLNISRIESGRLKFTYQTVQLENMIESVVEELTGTAEEKGIELEFRKLKNTLAKVIIDVEKIRQVLMNLVDNAVKYTDEGKVLITLHRENDNLVFCVKDNGLGILEDELPSLFKKFVRGSNAMLTHTEGTGLGLFVAKQMIEFHKGKIWAESEGENKGAKFYFELPIAAIEE